MKRADVKGVRTSHWVVRNGQAERQKGESNEA